MLAVILFVVIAIAALFVVNAVNRAQEKDRERRSEQRKLKVQADFLIDIVRCLEKTTPSKIIAKLINDEAIKLLVQIMEMERSPTPHFENNIKHAQAHSEKLAAAQHSIKANYQKETDAQIKYTHLQIDEANKVLRQLFKENIISDAELSLFEAELSWTYLMVSVASAIAEGQKLSAMGDHVVSKSLFQKAEAILTESTNQDPRRQEMIQELSEMIDGTRESMSKSLFSVQADPNQSAVF